MPVTTAEDPAAPAERWRSLEKLLVHRETLRCAEQRCVACCYKIALYPRPGLLPNVRPELCPRMAAATPASDQQRIGLYDAAKVQRLLTIGDGNFSYSLALARALPKVELVATSHESRETVVETYPDGERILSELDQLPNAKVLHEVDATNAEQVKALGTFDRVIWNFPCVRAPRGEDGQNKEMELNKQLLHGFFSHVAAVLSPGGEVHVTHKTKPPFSQWGIEEIAAANGLTHQSSVVFDRCQYPGYSNKKVLSKGSFPIWDSQTFVFVPKESQTEAKSEEGGAEQEEELVPVTKELLDKMYLLLTPTLDEKLGGKRKKSHKQLSGVKRERSDKAEKPDKSNKPGKPGKPEKPGKAGKGGKPSFGHRGDGRKQKKRKH